MIKRLTTWQVQEGLDEDKAVEHWLTRHIPLVLSVPGVQAYVQNRCVPGPDGERPPYTGLGEVWFDNPETAAAAAQSPEWAAVVADAQQFMDLSRIVVAWAEEHAASL
ncbi:EthD family reductase [Arthrobacter sp. MDT1-65]